MVTSVVIRRARRITGRRDRTGMNVCDGLTARVTAHRDNGRVATLVLTTQTTEGEHQHNAGHVIPPGRYSITVPGISSKAYPMFGPVGAQSPDSRSHGVRWAIGLDLGNK